MAYAKYLDEKKRIPRERLADWQRHLPRKQTRETLTGSTPVLSVLIATDEISPFDSDSKHGRNE